MRFRGVPKEAEELIDERIIKELAKWLELQEDEIIKGTEKIFRVKSDVAKANKWPGNCLISFNSSQIRDKILQTSNKRRLNWGERHYPKGDSFTPVERERQLYISG